MTQEGQNNEKHEAWDEMFQSLEQITDALGKHIEEGIRDTVVAFEMNGFHTDGSCAGHLEEDRLRFPYIAGEAAGLPTYHLEGQKELEKMITEKYAISRKEIRRHLEAAKEYKELSKDFALTNEFNEWLEKSRVMTEKLRILLEEFNQTRDVLQDVRLHLSKSTPNYRVEPVMYEIPPKELTQTEVDELRAKIISTREEFAAFTELLKQKYFSEK